MLDEKKNLLDKNALFNLRKKRKTASQYEKMKRLFFLIAVFFCIFLITLIYLLSHRSDIYHLTVTGNIYLKDEDVITKSGLSEDSKYYFTIPYLVEKKLEEDPLIAESKVEVLDDRLVRITVREKKLLGYTIENGSSVLLLEDDERIAIGSGNMYLITMVPIIEGFQQDDLILLEKNLAKCDPQIINEISEIHFFPEIKYQNVELIMRDGNYIFSSAYGLEILAHYHDIVSSYVQDAKSCYYFEDISGNAYTSACPWEKQEEENKKEDDKKETEETAAE